MKKTVNAFDYAGDICKALKKGILLTTKIGDKVNTMTIGWGHVGIVWGRPVFVAYVRETRHTRQMLDACQEFTVNVPVGEYDSFILGFCGTKSGRDVNKIEAMNLHLEQSDVVAVPGIRELPLTLECKVIYKQKQDLSAIPEDVLERYYPADESGFQDYHYVYYGQIVNSYLIME